ncbi:hypothetical protein ACTPD5_21030, partial [Clostridioides difficile]
VRGSFEELEIKEILSYVKIPTERIFVEAVKQNGKILKYVENHYQQLKMQQTQKSYKHYIKKNLNIRLQLTNYNMLLHFQC